MERVTDWLHVFYKKEYIEKAIWSLWQIEHMKDALITGASKGYESTITLSSSKNIFMKLQEMEEVQSFFHMEHLFLLNNSF